MLTRIWHGRTSAANADAYERLLRTDVLPGIAQRGIDGYRGAFLLRRELEDGPEFVTVLQFDSPESVQAFAGEDAEQAVVPPEARALLERFDERAAHYETVAVPAERRESAGWFVVNARDAAWYSNDALGAGCVFEGDGRARFAELGFRVRVLWPGQPNANYHSEASEEHFLVLQGRCLLLVDGEERELGPWDFVHTPPGVAHAFVGTGDGPCVLVMAGARKEEPGYVYPVSELARRHGAGVDEQTTDPSVAYARFPAWEERRPEGWTALPWGRP